MNFKLADISPIFKKKDGLDKENYRPVSVLHHVSKIFERIMQHPINDFVTDQLTKQLTGFRKNHGEKIILHNAVSDFSVGNVEENIR